MGERIVVITGVPGAGKSTVVNGALEKLKAHGISYSIVNYGDVMLKLMREREGIKDRDDMRKVPADRYRKIQREAATEIARTAEDKPIIVDTHCLVKKPEGYYPGLPSWVLDELKPRLIILVEAPSDEISGRRTKDASRRRDKEVLADVDEHQLMNRTIAAAYAALTGAAIKIIHNRDKGLNEAVEEMVSVLR